MKGDVVLTAKDLTRHYSIDRGTFRSPAILKALDGASFTLVKGKTLAVVGESGCGKSTLARMVTMIEKPTSGSLVIGGVDVVSAEESIFSGEARFVQLSLSGNHQQYPEYYGYAPIGLSEVRFGGSAVPEPATWAMLIAGFGMVGGAIRARRVRPLAA